MSSGMNSRRALGAGAVVWVEPALSLAPPAARLGVAPAGLCSDACEACLRRPSGATFATGTPVRALEADDRGKDEDPDE